VLLHGWAMHSGLWQPVLPELASQFRVHLVDLPGHGRSAPMATFTVDCVAALLEQHFSTESEPLDVLGWSLGGLVAMRWAGAHPARVKRLALMCTSPLFVRRPDWPHAMDEQTLVRFGDELRVNYRATLLRFLTLQVKSSEQGKASLATLRAALFERGEPAPAMLARGLELLAHTDLRADVPALALPALVLAGERDTLALPAAGEWLAQHLPQARFELIRGAGHAPFLSHPALFLAALRTLIAP
jgi:pimeloyl-[acyl-carrier protein] methyl ester esterase